MQLVSTTNSDSLAIQAEALLLKYYESQKKVLRCFFPTGRSSEKLYKILSSRISADGKSLFWHDKLAPLQIDEFIGNNNFFYQALSAQLLKPLQLEKIVQKIDATWNPTEFEKHIKQVLSAPIDIAILGLGPNGHIGFHEPALQAGREFLGGEITLCEESYQRVKNAPSRRAFTFGAGAFLQAKKIILLATGEDKSKIFVDFLRLSPTANLPATLLKEHPDLTVLTDLKL